MKIRNGFVSNSSATSFLIRYKISDKVGGPSFGPDKSLVATKADYKKLKKYGFQETCAHWIEHIDEHDPKVCDTCTEKGTNKCYKDVMGTNLYFFVSCNEDEPIKFLIENDIPFIAYLPYDEELMVYRRGSKEALVIENEGKRYLMGSHDHEPGYFDNSEDGKWERKRKKDYKTARLVPKDVYVGSE